MSSFFLSPVNENKEINFNIPSSSPSSSSFLTQENNLKKYVNESNQHLEEEEAVEEESNNSISHLNFSLFNHSNSLFLSPNKNDNSKIENEISSCERRQKEEKESEELAWRLMEEESMRAYEMQIEYMNNNPQLFSQEELQAFNSLLHENIRAESEEDIEQQQQQQHEEEEGDEEEEDNSEAWTYDNLLEIARLVGGKEQKFRNLPYLLTLLSFLDVKTERWRLRSNEVFQSLHFQSYQHLLTVFSFLYFIILE